MFRGCVDTITFDFSMKPRALVGFVSGDRAGDGGRVWQRRLEAFHQRRSLEEARDIKLELARGPIGPRHQHFARTEPERSRVFAAGAIGPARSSLDLSLQHADERGGPFPVRTRLACLANSLHRDRGDKTGGAGNRAGDRAGTELDRARSWSAWKRAPRPG